MYISHTVYNRRSLYGGRVARLGGDVAFCQITLDIRYYFTITYQLQVKLRVFSQMLIFLKIHSFQQLLLQCFYAVLYV